MASFGNLRHESIVDHVRLPITGREDQPALENAGLLSEGERDSIGLVTDGGRLLSSNDISDQFVVFQFSTKTEGPRILETSKVEPSLDGSAGEPDVLAKLQLHAFHTGASENIGDDTRATMRIDFGKDESSKSPLDAVFWSITAGLNLYNKAKNQKAESKEMKSDFDAAFSNRPIEIPGGLGKLSFEVVKHKEPEWWEKIFSFITGPTGKALTAAIGFPAITTEAIGMVNEMINRMLDRDKPDVIFKSRPMTLALSKRARDEFTGGLPGVSLGSLNAGFCLLARGGDYGQLVAHDPNYKASYGKLVPASVSDEDFLAGNYDDPFKDMTYAVFRVGTKASTLDPDLGFGS